ncbi:AlgI2 [Desulforapulum autotrophicum HRM2]|uniref:AlgI2 n=1 Tax=Desulforapulum autotrophicum (strain ATCC 43914 / DSM 3382 / VKM B-1955 / HRM2) TaxID=177437 RepID=C0QK45_DESAH|nr:MBOAT family O-acyltransferase [Desulforapulum autotrophicum]ACN16071.1 AlgI2 [Desulforapulum autotrophicum HRM2]
MVFSSITFIFYFLPVFLLGYFFTRYRNAFLLLISLFFYAWGEVGYVFLILGSSIVNYGFGRWIAASRDGQKKRFLFAGIFLNLLVICGFKYLTFLTTTLNALTGMIGFTGMPVYSIHLPLGISFFTFQAMSYLVDVYRGDAPVEKNPFNLMLYIAMFPQLVAGPIVRFQSIYAKIHKRVVTLDAFVEGIGYFIIGLGQKVLIANTVASTADKIFALPMIQLDQPLAWLGAVTYTLQIYYDFAGYSNMAIGLGLMVGFRFPENFNFPYVSRSITEFWRRWHMTLSRWFRDYLYIPLGGNQRGAARTYFNLFVVFFLCGLWHGASWTFVAWGVYHGCFLIVERMGLSRILGRMPRGLTHLYAMLVVVFGWVLFRAESFSQAGIFMQRMVGMGAPSQHQFTLEYYLQTDVLLALFMGVVFSLPIKELIPFFRFGTAGECHRAFFLLRSLCMVTFQAFLLFFSIMSLSSGSYNPFIYFRF